MNGSVVIYEVEARMYVVLNKVTITCLMRI